MTNKITTTLNLPKEIQQKLNLTDQAFDHYTKKLIAMDLYKNKQISLSYCAEIAEMSLEDFILYLGENKISLFNFDNITQFMEDAQNA